MPILVLKAAEHWFADDENISFRIYIESGVGRSPSKYAVDGTKTDNILSQAASEEI